MLLIGLTGGIGSGKTTVAKVFEVLGIPVYYADEQAKRIMNEDELVREKIKTLFGEESYEKGKLNRSYIASIVFKDAEKLRLLNSVVHPATIADGEQWMKMQTTPYAIKEAALIFESGSNKQLDYVIGVSSPGQLRMARVMARDSITDAEVKRRMQNQMPEEEKINLCDFVIVNDEQQLIIPQVLEIHGTLVQRSTFNV